MKIISVLNDIKNIEDLKICDEIIIPTIYSISYEYAFNADEIRTIVETYKDYKFILGLDSILSEDMLDDVFSLLSSLKDLNMDVLFSDMAILFHYQSLKKVNKLIYNASTYICNYQDIEYFLNSNIRVFISNELSKEDLIKNCEYDNVILQAYGLYPIYYSKRKVLSLYKDYSSLDYNPFKEYKIKEEKREEKYIIREYENNSHSIIYNAYKILIFNELNEIKPAYIFINSNDVEVLNTYKKGVEEGFSLELENYLKSIDEGVDKSLMYIRPSILNKDE